MPGYQEVRPDKQGKLRYFLPMGLTFADQIAQYDKNEVAKNFEFGWVTVTLRILDCQMMYAKSLIE